MRLPDISVRLQTLPGNGLEGLVHTTGLAGGFDFRPVKVATCPVKPLWYNAL